jgi:hypothetical protein
MSPYAHIRTYNEAATALIPLEGYDVSYANDKLKFPPHKLGKTAVIDHGITTRRAGAELV